MLLGQTFFLVGETLIKQVFKEELGKSLNVWPENVYELYTYYNQPFSQIGTCTINNFHSQNAIVSFLVSNCCHFIADRKIGLGQHKRFH